MLCIQWTNKLNKHFGNAPGASLLAASTSLLANTLSTCETATWPACWPHHGDLGNGDCFQNNNLRICVCVSVVVHPKVAMHRNPQNNVCFKFVELYIDIYIYTAGNPNYWFQFFKLLAGKIIPFWPNDFATWLVPWPRGARTYSIYHYLNSIMSKTNPPKKIDRATCIS